MHRISRVVMGCTLLGLVLVLQPACSKKAAPAAAVPTVESAIVPGADILFRMDLAAIRSTPIQARMKAWREKSQANTQAAEQAGEEILKAAGLTEEDIQTVLVSASMQNAGKAQSGAELAKSVELAMAIQLVKPITFDQLRAATKKMTDMPGAITEANIDGTPALKLINDKQPDMAAFAAISADGKLILVAINEQCMRGTLDRAKKCSSIAMTPALETIEKRQPAGAQIKGAFVLPAALREAMQAKMKEASKGGNMMIGMLKPFENMKSITVSGTFTDKLEFRLSSELGSDQDALQIASLIPMLAAFMPSDSKDGSADMMRNLSVTNDGPVLQASITITEQDLQSFAEKAESAVSMPPAAPKRPAPAPAVAPVQPVPEESPIIINTDAPAQPVAAEPVQVIPENVQAAPVAPDAASWQAAKKLLKVGATMTGKAEKKPSAYINNSVYSVGDVITVDYNGMTYRWKVRSIEKQNVKFDQLDAVAE